MTSTCRHCAVILTIPPIIGASVQAKVTDTLKAIGEHLAADHQDELMVTASIGAVYGTPAAAQLGMLKLFTHDDHEVTKAVEDLQGQMMALTVAFFDHESQVRKMMRQRMGEELAKQKKRKVS